MYHYIAFGLALASAFELAPCLSADSKNIDVNIRKGPIKLPPLINAKISRAGIEAKSGTDSLGNLYLKWEGVASFKAEKGHTLWVDPFTEDPQLLALFIISEALGMILLQRGYFLLHAGAVEVNGKAWVFMGTPGAGKSTTTAAFVNAGGALLSDDLVAIQTANNEAAVQPAFPQLKVWDTTLAGLGMSEGVHERVREGANKFALSPRFSQAEVSLEKIFLIHQNANESGLMEIPASDLPKETLAHFPLPIQFLTPEVTKTMFWQSLQIAGRAKVYSMLRPKGFAALSTWAESSVHREKPLTC